ncbi:MAG: peptidoglycan-binding protein [Nocardioides sp.]
MRRRTMLFATLAVFAGGAGASAGVDAARSGPTNVRRDQSATQLETVLVQRGTLRSLLRVTGTLGYLDVISLTAPRAGTVTALPKAGKTLRRGEALVAIDLRPVPVLYGALPVFRSLEVGVTGPDVLQLERNLVALGYGAELSVNEEFTSATSVAVRTWQKDLKVDITGSIKPGDVVVVPGKVRLATPLVKVGSTVTATDEIVKVTSPRRGVTVDLDATKAPLAKVGSTVAVTPSLGSPLTGKIRSVVPVGEKANADNGSSGADSDGQDSGPKVSVLIDITAERETRRYDTLSASVDLTAEKRKNVLSVPVEALVAIDSRQFVVTIIEGSRRKQVRVTTGMFAQGQVEVTGALAEGDRVEVPTI